MFRKIQLKPNYKKKKCHFVIKNTFTEKNLVKKLYFDGKESVLDILNFKILTNKKIDQKIIDLKNMLENKDLPKFPIKTKNLMQEYDLVEGKTLGKKLKLLEEFWVNNEFNISKDQINRIIRN